MRAEQERRQKEDQSLRIFTQCIIKHIRQAMILQFGLTTWKRSRLCDFIFWLQCTDKDLISNLDLLYFVSTIYPSWVKEVFPTGWVSRSCHKYFSVSRSHSWASGSCHKPFWHNMYHAGSETDLSNLSCYYMQVVRSLHPSGSSNWAQLCHATPDTAGLAILSGTRTMYLWNFIQITSKSMGLFYCDIIVSCKTLSFISHHFALQTIKGWIWITSVKTAG